MERHPELQEEEDREIEEANELSLAFEILPRKTTASIFTTTASASSVAIPASEQSTSVPPQPEEETCFQHLTHVQNERESARTSIEKATERLRKCTRRSKIWSFLSRVWEGKLKLAKALCKLGDYKHADQTLASVILLDDVRHIAPSCGFVCDLSCMMYNLQARVLQISFRGHVLMHRLLREEERKEEKGKDEEKTIRDLETKLAFASEQFVQILQRMTPSCASCVLRKKYSRKDIQKIVHRKLHSLSLKLKQTKSILAAARGDLDECYRLLNNVLVETAESELFDSVAQKQKRVLSKYAILCVAFLRMPSPESEEKNMSCHLGRYLFEASLALYQKTNHLRVFKAAYIYGLLLRKYKPDLSVSEDLLVFSRRGFDAYAYD